MQDIQVSNNKSLRILRVLVTNIVTLFEAFIKWSCGALFGAAIMINFANVVGRYVFQMPIYWAEEVTILLVIVSVFMMSFSLTLHCEHLKTDILNSYLSRRGKAVFEAVLLTFSIVALLFFAYHSSTVVSLMMRFGQVTPVAEIPMFLVYGSVFIGFSLSAFASSIRLIRLIINYNKI